MECGDVYGIFSNNYVMHVYYSHRYLHFIFTKPEKKRIEMNAPQKQLCRRYKMGFNLKPNHFASTYFLQGLSMSNQSSDLGQMEQSL